MEWEALSFCFALFSLLFVGQRRGCGAKQRCEVREQSTGHVGCEALGSASVEDEQM